MVTWGRVRIVVAVLILAVALPLAVFAAVTSILVSPGAPIVVGSAQTYEVISSTPASVYTLRSRCLENPIGSWGHVFSNGSGVFGPFHEIRVGSQEYEGTATTLKGMPPQPTTSTLSRQITVVGPDSDSIIQGLNTNSTGFPRMELEVRFQVNAGSTKLRGMFDGWAEERIRRPHLQFDSGWSSEPGVFYWATDHIRDVKHTTLSDPIQIATWQNIPIGTVLDDFYQQNRFGIRNCNGLIVHYYFQERRFRRVNSGPSTWILVEITP